MRRIAIVKKWIIIIWLIISVAALVLVIHMVLNTMVSYKYEISEKSTYV